ncbi:MAG TPA: patatin-like phospholipase family protein [Beijerinckiaceae bacterium]|jgi:predicted acylesterase/phospholipase RssA
MITRRAFGWTSLSLAVAASGSARAATRAPKLKEETGRASFGVADPEATTVSGIANARFMADMPEAFAAALDGDAIVGQAPWLAVSSGGENGAFGAGLLTGWSAAGTRPAFGVVTGISTGALTAPFVFAGPRWDARLRGAYTEVTAADVFEFGATKESLLDTWPLERLIDREVTAELLADIAAEHRRGRRLFVITTNIDTGRPVAWNMGAIAASGAASAEALFQKVLLASSSIPGLFPPVYIDVETNGRRFREMHVDGGVTTPFFVAPESVIATGTRLPARQVYVIVNNQLAPDFAVTPSMTLGVLGRSLTAAVKAGTRLAIRAHEDFARRAEIDLRIATMPDAFQATASGPFDGRYMKALFAYAADLGARGDAFGPQPRHVASRDRTP